MNNGVNLNMMFSVILTDGRKNKVLGDFVVGVNGDTGIAMSISCDAKSELVYMIAALRDCADACQSELNRPENQLK